MLERRTKQNEFIEKYIAPAIIDGDFRSIGRGFVELYNIITGRNALQEGLYKLESGVKEEDIIFRDMRLSIESARVQKEVEAMHESVIESIRNDIAEIRRYEREHEKLKIHEISGRSNQFNIGDNRYPEPMKRFIIEV